MKTPITYYGGKQNLVKELLLLIPPHKLYVEAFAGGAALFFSKAKSEGEVLNDTNGMIVNFYKVVKEQFKELKIKVDATLHSRQSYEEAYAIYKHPNIYDPINKAWAFWVVTNQGFSGRINSWAFGNTNKIGITIANKKKAFSLAYADRLHSTQIESADALKLIKRYDSTNSFFYLDPPYFNSDCGHYKGYRQEDFKNLLESLSTIKGKFLLSNYPSTLLEKYIQKYGWNKQERTKGVSVTHTIKKEKTEWMVYNYTKPIPPTTISKKECKQILEKYGDKYKSKEVSRIMELLKQVEQNEKAE